VTAAAISNLLRIRGDSLSELHLQRCRFLDFGSDPDDLQVGRGRNLNEGGGAAGRSVLLALKSHGDECCLAVLDVQHCCGGLAPDGGYAEGDPFVQGMAALGFRQAFPGYFSRAAKWNARIQRRLVRQFASESEPQQALGNQSDWR